MELMKRDFLTVTDDGENIYMSLDTTHEDVKEVAKKMASIRAGLKMDGKYVMTLFGEAEGKGLYCVIRDEGDFIDW